MKGIKEETYTLTGLDKTHMLLIRDGLDLLANGDTYHPDTAKQINELQHELFSLIGVE